MAVLSLDFLGVPGAAIKNRTLELIARHGFPAGKVLGAGVIDGRSVWADTGRMRLSRVLLVHAHSHIMSACLWFTVKFC